MNVLSKTYKTVAFFLFCTTLLLQGCAMNKSNVFCAGQKGCASDNPEVDGRWNQYAQEVNPELARGNRIAGDGRTVLVPVRGAGVKGAFQTPEGTRLVHDRDCQREGGGSSFFWGWVVPLGSLASGGVYAPAIGQGVSNAARQHGSTARFYKCENAKEFFAGGNGRIVQDQIVKVKDECESAGGTFAFDAASGQGSCTTASAAPQAQSQDVAEVTPPVTGLTRDQKRENACARTPPPQSCTAGEWGPAVQDSAWVCMCR